MKLEVFQDSAADVALPKVYASNVLLNLVSGVGTKSLANLTTPR